MDTTIVALQNLYIAKGGELSAVSDLVTIPDMINALAELETTKAASPSTENE